MAAARSRRRRSPLPAITLEIRNWPPHVYPAYVVPIVLFNERRAILRLRRRLSQLASDKLTLRSFEVSYCIVSARSGSLRERLCAPHVAARRSSAQRATHGCHGVRVGRHSTGRGAHTRTRTAARCHAKAVRRNSPPLSESSWSGMPCCKNI
eukprot:6071956-Prymnesium_polylepis.1